MLAIDNLFRVDGSSMGTSSGQRDIATVLLVDDYQPQLAMWARDVEATGRTVATATTRAEAAQVAQKLRPCLAVVDLFLGSEDGLACVRELKEMLPNMCVIVVSSDMSVAYAMAAVRAGADDVLVKPLVVSEVIKGIELGDAIDPARTSLTLDEVEWEHISRALLESGKNITQAAERLGIYRQTLQRKLRKRVRERPDTES
jgi:two-component system, response regulator RegA